MKFRLYRRLIYLALLFAISITLTLLFDPYSYYLRSKYICLDDDCDTLAKIQTRTRILCKKYERYNIQQFTSLLLEYKRLDQIIDHPNADQIEGTKEMIENTMLEWFVPTVTIKSLTGTFANQGIVFTIDDHSFNQVYHSILVIASIHESAIPIHVYYLAYELSTPNFNRLNEIFNVQLHNLHKVFDETKIERGYNRNTLALFAAPCMECILVEDSLLVESPESLFSFPEYNETGLLLFKDSQNDGRVYDWLQGILLDDEFRSIQVDSSVVVVNKQKRLMTMLALVFIDTFKSRQINPQDGLWISAAIAKEAVSINDSESVSVGYHDQNEFCTVTHGQFDSNDKLIHFRFTSAFEKINNWIKECSESNIDKSSSLLCVTVDYCSMNTIDPQTKLLIDKMSILWNKAFT